jgi:thioredoxin 1
MPYAADYLPLEPTRADVDATSGLLLLEFGATDCGFCRAIQPALVKTLDTISAAHPDLVHQKIADGAGRPLGRSFHVKLWPTLVLLRDGVEVSRAVRPKNGAEISALFAPTAP